MTIWFPGFYPGFVAIVDPLIHKSGNTLKDTGCWMNCIIHASVCYWATVSDSGHNKLLFSVWLQVASIIDKFIPS